MSPNIRWAPHPGPQADFLASRVYEVFYGGAAGGGKSDCLLIDAAQHAKTARYRALLVRRSYPELQELIDRSRLLYRGKYSESHKRWTLPNGARIEFGYLERPSDVYRYQGQEYTYLGVDELTHLDEWSFLYLQSRVRTTDPDLTCYVRATSNPGGPGHSWVKSRFVDAGAPTVPIHDDLTGQSRVFIPSRLTDNPSLARTDYGRRLMALPEADRKALLEGDWNAYTGSVFDLKPGIHTWSWEQFKDRTGHDRIPSEWTRFRVMDWGYARPFAVYWIAVDYEGRGYVYREYYGCARDSKGAIKPNTGLQMEPTRAAEIIRDMEKLDKISIGWTGPDLFSAGTGDTSAGIKRSEYFERNGVHFVAWAAGPDSRRAKKSALHERLAYTEKDGTIQEYPGLIFLTDECPHAIRTIPALEYDPARGGEDIDSSMEDHSYDAVSAWCLMRPWRPQEPKSQIERLFGDRAKKGTWMSS